MIKIFSLTGKVALVTGSTKGIGLAVAKELARQGASIIINSRAELEDITEIIEKFDNKKHVTYIQANVTNEEDCIRMINKIKSTYGRLDILVNNVGKVHSSPIISLKSEDMDAMYLYNTKPTFLMMKLAIKMMILNKYGRIINISSMAGIKGFPMQSHYAAAKAAIVGLSRSAAREFGSKGITCNVIAPGSIRTKDPSIEYSQEMEKKAIEMTPLKRLGEVEDVAGTVAFLASDYASFITGEIIHVDGGMRM